MAHENNVLYYVTIIMVYVPAAICFYQHEKKARSDIIKAYKSRQGMWDKLEKHLFGHRIDHTTSECRVSEIEKYAGKKNKELLYILAIAFLVIIGWALFLYLYF